MRVACSLLFGGQSGYIDILSKEPSKNIWISIYDQIRIYLNIVLNKTL